MHPYLILTLLFTLLGGFAEAMPPQTHESKLLLLSSPKVDLRLAPFSRYLLVEKGEEVHLNQLERLKLQTPRGETLNFGVDDRAVWLVSQIQNPLVQPLNLVLTLGYRMLECDAYSRSMSGEPQRLESWRTGNWQLLYPIRLGPGEQKTFYFHCSSDMFLGFRLQLQDQVSYWQGEQQYQLYSSVYFTILALLFFYSLISYFSKKERVYLSYSLFLLCIAWMQIGLDGTLMDLLQDKAWIKRLAFAGVGITSWAMMSFMGELLNTSMGSKKIHLYSLFVKHYSLALTALSFVLPVDILRVLLPQIGLLMPSAMLLAGFNGYRRNPQVSGLFLLGSLFYLIGYLTYTIGYLGGSPLGMDLVECTYLLKLTALADAIVFLTAAYHLNREQRRQFIETKIKLDAIAIKFSSLMKNSIFGFAYFQIQEAAQGQQPELLLLEINKQILHLMDLPDETPLQSKAHLAFPQLFRDLPQLKEQLISVALSGKAITEQVQLSNSKKTYQLIAFQSSLGYTAITLVDVSDYIQIRNQLEIAKLDAEEASQVKTDFIANMSHELRTPLNGILGFTDLLLHTDPNSEQSEYLTNLSICNKKLLKLVEDVLTFNRLKFSSTQLQLGVCDLEELVRNCSYQFQEELKIKNLDLTLTISSSIQSSYLCDQEKICQVLFALLANAVKFTKEGQIKISLEISPHDPNLGVIQVEDTGIGIAPQDQQKVMGLFSQANNSSTRPYEGAGLGLALSQALSQLMGGSLWFNSQQERGSQFFFSFRLDIPKPLLNLTGPKG